MNQASRRYGRGDDDGRGAEGGTEGIEHGHRVRIGPMQIFQQQERS